MTFAKTQQGGEKYSQDALLIVTISQEVSVGREKYGVILSGSSNREVEEKQKAEGEGFGACSTSTSVSHGTVM